MELQNNQQIAGYTAAETTHQGKKHLVVPVTMIVEGVLNGSQGPLLHLAEDFGKIPESWNGMPVVIQHPEQNGKSISANSPGVIDASMVGRIYNSTIVENMLKAEAWLEVDKLTVVSNETLANVNSGISIEVSVGVYTENEKISGVWNGVKYNAIARNHRPDHLALLPGGVGACSLKDGCGIHANQKKGEQNVDRLNEVIKEIRSAGYSLTEIGANGEIGLKEKLDSLRSLVYGLDSNPSDGSGSYHYIEEVYADYMVYSETGKDGEKLYKRNYQFNVGTNLPEFTSDPVEVTRKVEYESINNNGGKVTLHKNEEDKSMAKECTPCVIKKVGELIANAATKFTEDDREFLQTLELSVLEKMEPIAATPPIIVDNSLSVEDKAALDFGKRALKQHRDTMIAGIQKNCEAGVWEEAELATMAAPMLEKLFKSTVKEEAPVDYSLNGNAAPFVNRTQKVVNMLPNVN